jgi:hypothetical protein
MYEERFTEPHKQGLERFTNSNAGRFFTNERIEQVIDQETGYLRTEYVYDVYEVADCRQPNKVKNSIITEEHPFGDEKKILRKTIRKMLSETKYHSEDFAEFRAYNEFCESV